MHAPGHVGVGLAAAAPLTVALEAVGLASGAVPATIALVGLSTLPDVDHHVPGMAHRSATHSLPFALAVGTVVAIAAWFAGPALLGGERATVAALGFATGALAVVLHVLADLVTPMGVYPLWPVSRERRSLDLIASADVRANVGLFLAGALAWGVVILGTAAS